MSAADPPAAPRGVPEGFVPMDFGTNPFVDSVGPLYGHRDEGLAGRLVLGLRVERRHCSPSGYCHGGMLATLADMLMVVGASLQSGRDAFMTTVRLSTDFLAPVPEGAWLEGRLEVLRTTRNLVFCQGLYRVDGEPALRVDAIVKPLGEATVRSGALRWFGGPPAA
ncbi:MAG TPA: PaaI family thioesterase [Burkholderiaceae bacterium]|nr:PaaI family thioesterase [Burkholderiaceae bacterium]